MNQTGSLGDLIAGKSSIKFEVSIDTVSIIILSVSVFFAVLIGVFIARKIS